MTTIGQRELRNDNAEIVRRVEAGESFTVTRRGAPVARLVPLGDSDDARADPWIDAHEFVAAMQGLTDWDAAAFRDDQSALDEVVDDSDRDPWPR